MYIKSCGRYWHVVYLVLQTTNTRVITVVRKRGASRLLLTLLLVVSTTKLEQTRRNALLEKRISVMTLVAGLMQSSLFDSL